MRLSHKLNEVERLRLGAQMKRADIERKQQNELKRYTDAGDNTGVQNVQNEINSMLAEAMRLEDLAATADIDARKLRSEIDDIQKAIDTHRNDLAAYEEQVRVAQDHVDSIKHEIANLTAHIQSIS